MNKNIIFIAGIHGVGKTTLCKKISTKYNIDHFSASELISNYKNMPFTSLFIDGINKNQDILVNAVYNLFDSNKQYILDGHFCLLNKNQSPEKIPQQTFEDLGIKHIIVLTEDINQIFSRLRIRNNQDYDLNMLKNLQDLELSYSQQIASILNVPYDVINLSTITESILTNKFDLIFDKI